MGGKYTLENSYRNPPSEFCHLFGILTFHLDTIFTFALICDPLHLACELLSVSDLVLIHLLGSQQLVTVPDTLTKYSVNGFLILLFIYLFKPHCEVCGIFNQGLNLSPLQWKHGFLTTVEVPQ